jgi:membrane-bound lytic murein transglycosylase A
MSVRNFFEREFSAYQIHDEERRTRGVVTGYFEPELPGSRTYSRPYIYPIYGQPEDMLYLDTRQLPASGIVTARVQGRQVIVQQGALNTNDLGAGLFALDLSQVRRGTLDRKMRLRIEGKRLLPYYTREEIEARGAPNARVLAIVKDATALYEMQIQGSGRIRLTDGSLIRLAYADQNGQPFKPMLTKKAAAKVRTRGGAIELDAGDDIDDNEDDPNTTSVRVRGFKLALPVNSGPVAVPGQKPPSTSTSTASSTSALGTGNSDPSYVFFRVIANDNSGPLGAQGVPLVPERSIAVDPRSTPLGYPVFVSTTQPGGSAPIQRLTVAQDTGGAIRGPVRADYFFGNGQRAASLARSMKELGQLWILLPRGQTVAGVSSRAVRSSDVQVRGDADNTENLAQCLIPEEGVCVNDN